MAASELRPVSPVGWVQCSNCRIAASACRVQAIPPTHIHPSATSHSHVPSNGFLVHLPQKVSLVWRSAARCSGVVRTENSDFDLDDCYFFHVLVDISCDLLLVFGVMYSAT